MRAGYLGLGSNVGDRAGHLRAAIELLRERGVEVEAARGRALDAPRHSPRPLDVDLLLLGDVELSTDRLTLPHPEVTSRRFVLAPLLELDAGLALPDGTRLADALAALGPGQLVQKLNTL